MKTALEINKRYSDNYTQKLRILKIPEMINYHLNAYTEFLDLGCGDGRLIKSIKKQMPGLKLTGVDISSRRIKELQNEFPNDTFLVEDVCHTSLKDDSFNLIACEQTIEHVKNDKDLVSEIARLLKPKGVLYITSVIKKPWGWYKYKNRHGKRVLDPTHEREYENKKQFLDLIFNTVGFRLDNKKDFEQGNFQSYFWLLEIKVTPVRRKLLGLDIPIPGYYIIEALFTTTY